jgi:hypothetical protein
MKRGRVLVAGVSEIDWILLGDALAARGIEAVYTTACPTAIRLLGERSFGCLLVDLLFEKGVDLLLHARMEHRDVALCIAGRVREGNDLYQASFPGEPEETMICATSADVALRIDRLLAARAAEHHAAVAQQSV